jgi:hypothetical protein
VCLCVRVCLRCMFVCVCMCVHARMQVHVCVYICVCVHMYVCVYACVYVYVCNQVKCTAERVQHVCVRTPLRSLTATLPIRLASAWNSGSNVAGCAQQDRKGDFLWGGVGCYKGAKSAWVHLLVPENCAVAPPQQPCEPQGGHDTGNKP